MDRKIETVRINRMAVREIAECLEIRGISRITSSASTALDDIDLKNVFFGQNAEESKKDTAKKKKPVQVVDDEDAVIGEDGMVEWIN